MKQKVSDTVGARKRAAQERLFLLLENDLPTRRTRARNGAELEGELRNQLDEARVKPGGGSENDVQFEEKDLYSENTMAVKDLEKLLEYRVY